MQQHQFHDFILAGARRAIGISSLGAVGHLVLTQTRNQSRGHVPKIREPELRHGLAQEAEARCINYGIEVPTKGGYRFTKRPGAGETTARHDFALLTGPRHDSDRSVLLELKEGSIGVAKISKDVEKLFRESATCGKSVIHILQGCDRASITSLLGKYALALASGWRAAASRATFVDVADESWFSLFLLVVSDRCLWHWHSSRTRSIVTSVPAPEALARAAL